MSAMRSRVLAAASAPNPGEDEEFEALATSSLVMAYNRMFPSAPLQPRTDIDQSASAEGVAE